MNNAQKTRGKEVYPLVFYVCARRRSGRVSLKRPAADGESCEQDSISFGHLQLLVFQQVLVSHTGLARSPDEPEEASGMGMLWQCRGP